MKKNDMNSLEFFREYYRIPTTQELSWCVIVYLEPERTLNLGVALIGTDKVIDIAAGRFIQATCDNPENPHYSYLATRKTDDGCWFKYIARNGSTLCQPKRFIEDMYYRRVYSEEMIQDLLL